MQVKEFIPYLSVNNAVKAVEFYSKILETEPYLLFKMPDGRVMHCEFRIENARFFVSEELPEHGGTPSPKTLKATTVAIYLYVSDCDIMVQRMLEHGAEILMEPADMFWGERFARVRDPFGHEWGLATKIKEMSVAEIEASAESIFKEMEK